MRRIDRLIIAAAAAFAPGGAFAACTASTTAVSFGTYDTLSAINDDSVGTITVDCNAGERNIVASINGGSSGSIAARTLRNGATILNYNLYTTAGRNIIWGDGTSGSTVTLNFVNSAGGVRHYNGTVYGRIPALQPVGPGVYTDTVTVTITY
jgi:spore coat protein U-like protein